MLALHVQRDARSRPAPTRRAPARCRSGAGARRAAPASAPARRARRRSCGGTVRARPCAARPGGSRWRRGRSTSCAAVRPCGAAVAGRPVGAAQAGVGQAHERAEHDHAQRQRDRQPGEAMEMPIDGRLVTAGLWAWQAGWRARIASSSLQLQQPGQVGAQAGRIEAGSVAQNHEAVRVDHVDRHAAPASCPTRGRPMRAARRRAAAGAASPARGAAGSAGGVAQIHST